jgi:hypothetical protein
MADTVEKYFEECRQKTGFPQIWVSSEAGVKHLDVLADRLRYNQQNVRVRRFGEQLSYATERYPIDGQQALHSASRALRLHYATGQQEAEDEHLGVLLTWINPPKDRNVLAAVAVEEQIPMGVKTDPEFDKQTLAKIVYAYDAARRKGAGKQELSNRHRSIHAVLEPIVMRVYNGTQTAIALLQTHFPQPLPAVSDLRASEGEAFESFMRSRDSGYPLPLRDKPKAAAFKISEREIARQTAEAALCAGDRVTLTRARMAGRVLSGVIENGRRIRVGPRRFEVGFDIVSEQRVLRVRQRDELYYLSDIREKIIVQNVQRTGRTTRVSVVIVKGARAVGLPRDGSLVDFLPDVPEWEQLIRMRVQLSQRLATPPWTHSAAALPAAVPNGRPRPADLVTAVEALR